VSEGIGIERLEALIDEGAQVVEVLPEQEFEEEHLPGAINLPLKKLNLESAETLDRARPVIVYCWDGL
jgi:rhodanese-related sulfurtransferase